MRRRRLTGRYSDPAGDGGAYVTLECSTNRCLGRPGFHGHGKALTMLTALSLKALITQLRLNSRLYPVVAVGLKEK